MIRIGKPVKLQEWDKGTTTMNQCWNDIATGELRTRPKNKAGVTVLEVELNGAFEKKNDKDDTIKIMQKGEGMTPNSDAWGEVAIGRLKSVEGKTVYIEIKTALKIGKGL